MREQEIVLKDETDRPPLGGHVLAGCGVFEDVPVERYAAGIKGDKTRQGPEERGLSRTVRPQQGNHLPLVDRELHVEVERSK